MLLLTAAVSLDTQLGMLSYDVPRTRLHRGGSAGFGPLGWEMGYLEGNATTPLLVMNSPSTGSVVIVLKAAQLSKHDYSLSGRVAASAAQVTMWTSDTLCTLQTAGGDVWSQPLTATLALQVSTLSMVFTYDHARGLSGALRGNVPSTGSVRVSIQGAGFGLAGCCSRLRVAETAAEATSWTSDSTIALGLSQFGMVRASAAVVLTSGMLRRGTQTQAVSFDCASSLSYRPRGAGQIWRRNVAHAKSVASLTVHGALFGAVDASPAGAMGASTCCSTGI